MMSNNSFYRRLTSLPLKGKGYRFALSDEERKMTGDDWAWRFLRLNPLYRHDYALWRNYPVELYQREGISLKNMLGQPPRQDLPPDIGILDSRYFCAHNEILGNALKWSAYIPITLDAFLKTHKDLRISDIQIRNLCSSWDYGIGAWFSPDQEALPPLETDQSWFFCLTEPIWHVSSVRLTGSGVVWATADERQRAIVGILGDVKYQEHMKFFVPRKTLRGYELAVIDEKIGPSLAQVPPEMTFLVNLDGYIAPQLASVFQRAESFQKLLIGASIISRPVRVPVGREPDVYTPDRALGGNYGAFQGTLSDLLGRASSPRRNWKGAVIDVSYDLPEQQTFLLNFLTAEQKRLHKHGVLKNPIRMRFGGKTKGDFWLKRYLCLLEMQINIQTITQGRPPGPDRLAAAIENAKDPLHKHIYGTSTVPLTRSDVDAARGQLHENNDRYKDAIEQGKEFATHYYELLVGTPAERLASQHGGAQEPSVKK